jgi:hypothetical protein
LFEGDSAGNVNWLNLRIIIGNETETAELCGICGEEIEEDSESIKMPCNHVYHKDC